VTRPSALPLRCAVDTIPTMKAAVRTIPPAGRGRIANVDTPTPGDHEVLVEVHATTVNRTDCGSRAARPWIVRFFSGLLKPR
jgi:NADPH:quinone reductase-like Zn-dependent oxidoreductase